MRRDTEQLIAAYVDGVVELTADERRRVEALLARDSDAKRESEATRAMLDQLRGLPAEGSEPDWAAMERAIGTAVGRELPRPWWRNWKWIAPIATCAAGAAILLATWSHGDAHLVSMPALPALPTAAPSPVAEPSHVALWLDGSEVEIDPASPDAIGAIEAIENQVGMDDVVPEGANAGGIDDVGLLPATDLAWVDGLDDAALDRAEQWLATRKKG